MSKRPAIPLPPAVQPHELQYRLLREQQALQRGGPSGSPASEGRGSSRAYGGDSQRSGSRRGGSERYGGSERSGRSASSAGTSSTARTGASISSSVALGTLNKLEAMLMEERRARQGAESMLLSLQKERVAREDAVRQSEATRRQLEGLMTALRSVVKEPNNAANVQRLQSLLDTTRVDNAAYAKIRAEALAADNSSGADRFAKNGTSLAPPVDAKYSKKITHALPAIHEGSTRSASSSRGGQKTFLDGMGHYERARERERQREKAERRGVGQ